MAETYSWALSGEEYERKHQKDVRAKEQGSGLVRAANKVRRALGGTSVTGTSDDSAPNTADWIIDPLGSYFRAGRAERRERAAAEERRLRAYEEGADENRRINQEQFDKVMSLINSLVEQEKSSPYYALGQQAAQRLAAVMANPALVKLLPGYQEGLSEGVNTLQNSLAARRNLLSGGAQKKLIKFGSDYFSGKLNEHMQALERLAGFGERSRNRAGNYMLGGVQPISAYGANQMNINNNLAQALANYYGNIGQINADALRQQREDAMQAAQLGAAVLGLGVGTATKAATAGTAPTATVGAATKPAPTYLV